MDIILNINRRSNLKTDLIDFLPPNVCECGKCDQQLQDCECFGTFHNYTNKTLTKKDFMKMLHDIDSDVDLTIEQERNDARLEGLYNKIDIVRNLRNQQLNLHRNVDTYYKELLFRIAHEIEYTDTIREFLDDVSKEVEFEDSDSACISQMFIDKYKLENLVTLETSEPPNSPTRSASCPPVYSESENKKDIIL